MGRNSRRQRQKKTKKQRLSFQLYVLVGFVILVGIAVLNIHVVVQSGLWDATADFVLQGNRGHGILQNPEQCVAAPAINTTSMPPTGIVVILLLGGDNPQLKNSICSLFPSQLTHFIVPHHLDVLLVLSGNLLEQTIVDCLELTLAVEKTTTSTNLDGSTLTIREYQATTVIAGTPHFTKVLVAYQPSLPLPLYLQRNASILKEPIQPPMCQAPFEYIQGTRWYTKELFDLHLLGNYEYWIKLDPDVVFVKPLEFNLLYDMKIKGAIFGHTAEYPPGVPTPCSDGIAHAVLEFVQEHSVCALPSTILDADHYYTNFIVGRTDFFQSPHVRHFADWLSEYSGGFFHHRWTDQIFWQVALTLFLWPNVEDYVADYTDLRCTPLPNCWMSSLDLKKYPQKDVCENGGVFVHTKHALHWVHRWNRFSARKDDYSLEEQVPYTSRYRHDCRGTRWQGNTKG